MPMFRKKPVVIEACQWGVENEEPWPKGWEEGVSTFRLIETGQGVRLVIPTLEGNHVASPGDWIIRGVAGEFYPCKPDIFAATYEPAPSAAPARETKEDDRG
jgi:hypothetical protein